MDTKEVQVVVTMIKARTRMVPIKQHNVALACECDVVFDWYRTQMHAYTDVSKHVPIKSLVTMQNTAISVQ